jgi:hypothetical protein
MIGVVSGDLRGVEVGDRICELSARVHATMAELVGLAADFDDGHGWDGYGIRSCAHWLAINAGVDVWTGMEMVRVGQALRQLPLLAAAFASGELSFDKLRHVTRVARPADEELWLEVALHASGSQLARICRGFERATGGPGTPDAHLARRGLRSWWRPDGMLELVAVLRPEDGALVLAALEKVQLAAPAAEAAAGDIGVVLDPAEDPLAARRADALVELTNQWLAGSASHSGEASHRLVVHIDLDALMPEGGGRVCHVQDGPPLPSAVARRIGCDTELVAIAERDGVPIDVGRSRRTISPRQRLALQARDSTCRFPGCGVPASRTEGHHLLHWAEGGRTDLDNLLSLCRFHHHRLHDGAFDILAQADGKFRFEAADGRPIGSESRTVLLGTAIPHYRDLAGVTPRARDGGRACDFGHVIETLAESSRAAVAARAGPSP